MRSARAGAMVFALAAMGACGDDAAPAVVADASADGGCAPQDMSAWKPTWRPPQLPRWVCSDQQLERVYSVCVSASSTNADCFAWNRDPVNAACLQCLYSTEDEPTYGPIVYLKNRSLLVNIPGCVSIIEGNNGATSCGAELQGYYSCTETACMTTCAVYEDYQRCQSNAGQTTCAKYRAGNVCGDPSMYEPCVEQDSFDDYFKVFARLFCGPIADGGSSSPDGGGARDGGDGGGVPDASLSASRVKRGAPPSNGLRFPDPVLRESPAAEAIGEALRR